MFKVNNKDTRTTDTITYFTLCSSVSIVNIEQVNTGWKGNAKRQRILQKWSPYQDHLKLHTVYPI